MRRLCALALFAALGAALLPAPAIGQQPVVPIWVDSNGKNNAPRLGAGGFPVNEQSRDRDFRLLQPNIISNIFGDGNACANIVDFDSSGFYDVRGYTRLRLRVRVAAPNTAGAAPTEFCNVTPAYTVTRTAMDSIFTIHFGFQPRFNTSAVWDTTSGMVKVDWRRSPTGGAASSAVDSAGSMTEALRPLGSNPDHGEFVFVWPNVAGPLGTGANRHYQIYTREVDLIGRDGQPLVGDFFGLRVRTIDFYFDASPPTAMPVGKPMFVTIDLLAARQ